MPLHLLQTGVTQQVPDVVEMHLLADKTIWKGDRAPSHQIDSMLGTLSSAQTSLVEGVLAMLPADTFAYFVAVRLSEPFVQVVGIRNLTVLVLHSFENTAVQD